MRINEVMNSMKKKTHDLIMIQILSCFIHNEEIQNKVEFTDKIYKELQKNIALYLQAPSSILYNYIDNDEVILEQAIIEMKEEVYCYFHTQTLLILDGLTNEELLDVYHMFNGVTYNELFSLAHCQIVENVNLINGLIKELKQGIQSEVLEKDLKFIPFSKDKDLFIDENISNSFFIQLYQNIKTTLKYLPKAYSKQEILLKMRNIYLLMIIEKDLKKGDNDVSKSN